jgi:hypothetical protein
VEPKRGISIRGVSMHGSRKTESINGGSVDISENSPRRLDPPKNSATEDMKPSTKVGVAKAVKLSPRSEIHVTVQNGQYWSQILAEQGFDL